MINGYLEQYEVKELRRDCNERVKNNGHLHLAGSNKKATVYTNAAGERVLRSYYIDVCKINKHGKFTRLWSGYSVTTMNHVNEFRKMNGLNTINKKEWQALNF